MTILRLSESKTSVDYGKGTLLSDVLVRLFLKKKKSCLKKGSNSAR